MEMEIWITMAPPKNKLDSQTRNKYVILNDIHTMIEPHTHTHARTHAHTHTHIHTQLKIKKDTLEH